MSHGLHIEIVRTDAGWHSRIVAGNGQPVWTTESYRTKRAAIGAIDRLARYFSPTGQAWISNVRIGNERHVDVRYGSEEYRTWDVAHKVEIRLIDERTP